MGASSCDLCAHYVYDDEDDFSECMRMIMPDL